MLQPLRRAKAVLNAAQCWSGAPLSRFASGAGRFTIDPFIWVEDSVNLGWPILSIPLIGSSDDHLNYPTFGSVSKVQYGARRHTRPGISGEVILLPLRAVWSNPSARKTVMSTSSHEREKCPNCGHAASYGWYDCSTNSYNHWCDACGWSDSKEPVTINGADFWRFTRYVPRREDIPASDIDPDPCLTEV